MLKRHSEHLLDTKCTKRKHVSFSIQDKVELLHRLDSGASVKFVCDEYGIGTSTVYDVRKHKDQLLKFYSNSDSPELMANRKTLHQAKTLQLTKY